jgi:hypothetical protein
MSAAYDFINSRYAVGIFNLFRRFNAEISERRWLLQTHFVNNIIGRF